MKRCRYSLCHRLLSPFDETVNGCCNKIHSRLAKQEYNEKYYGRTKLNNKIVKHADIFKTCIQQFGQDAEIDANFLQIMGIEWKFETHRVMFGNLEYIAVGDYAYIISSTQKVKIKRL